MKVKHALRVVLTWNAEIYPHYPDRFVSGTFYAPHIILPADDSHTHWSVRMIIEKRVSNLSCEAKMAMLAHNYEADEFFSNLEIGTKFALSEGGSFTALGFVKEFTDHDQFQKEWKKVIINT